MFLNQLWKGLLVISLSLLLLHFGALLFIPMAFGLLIAFVLYPFCIRLEQYKLPKTLAITTSLMIVVFLFAGLIMLLVGQLRLFNEDIPQLSGKLKPLLSKASLWLQERFAITRTMQEDWLYETLRSNSSKMTVVLQRTFNGIVNTAFMLFLIPIYAALFLYHRSAFVRFVKQFFGKGHDRDVDAILKETVYTYSGYIKGMVMVYLIVGVLNSLGLMALGIKHAFLFGMLTAIMTIIPYVGIIISALLPISMAFITKDSLWYPIGVVGVFTFVQYLEANLIFPLVVGRQLNVSTWATLVAIIAGGIVWGVSGMILFIPFVAILKIISARLPGWEPLHTLLGRHE